MTSDKCCRGGVLVADGLGALRAVAGELAEQPVADREVALDLRDQAWVGDRLVVERVERDRASSRINIRAGRRIKECGRSLGLRGTAARAAGRGGARGARSGDGRDLPQTAPTAL
jgi:hypothetical protein